MTASAPTVKFARSVIMVRGQGGVSKATTFYQALGLTVVRQTEQWAEMACMVGNSPGAFRLSIKAVDTESHLSTGYSPFLNFEVKNLNGAVAKCVQLGGQLDGPIQYPSHGKVAVMRSPDGHMIGLYEPAVGFQ